jgi:phage terminase large subunit-like protein
MRWQRDLADVSGEIDPDTGLLFYRTVVVTVMRQQGKTRFTLPLWVQRCLRWPDIHVKWTMQHASDARLKWMEEHVPILTESDLSEFLLPGSEGVRKQNGSEHVKFRNGSMQTLMSTKKTSGHGQVVDLGIVDEAMAQPDDRLHQALRPAMKTRYRAGLPGAQLWIISTVGVQGESEWFHSWVDAGRAAVEAGTCEEDRICFVDYSAPDDADPGDPAVWRACMPALGATIDESTVAAEYREAMLLPDGLAGFRRQALNQRTSQRADPVIPLHLWDRCVAMVDRDPSAPVWAVDVSPEQASAAICVGWMRPDGVPQVQVVEHRDGVGWLPGRVSELRAEWPGVWLLDPRGGSASQAEGWPGLTVKPAEARQACAELEAAVREGVFGHYGQVELRTALEGAVKRPQEDGGWSWARRSTSVDISPLVAASLCLHGVLAGLTVRPVPVVLFG